MPLITKILIALWTLILVAIILMRKYRIGHKNEVIICTVLYGVEIFAMVTLYIALLTE